MKKIALFLLLLAGPAAAQDDCPVGHVRNPQVSPLDHDYMLSAYTASFRGLFGRAPTLQPGSGTDDGEYYIAAANHFGVYGDDQCHAGWSGYWESWLQTGHGDLTLVQTPARFLPSATPPVVTPPDGQPGPPGPPGPKGDPGPAADLTGILSRLDALEARVGLLDQHETSIDARTTALEAKTIYTQCRASVLGIAVSCRLQ